MLETYIAPRAYAALKQAIEQADKQAPVAKVIPGTRKASEPPGMQKAAEHWHGLYLAKCRELHDERARLGQQICDLEHDLKEKNHG